MSSALPIFQQVNSLPTSNLTVRMLQALDFVVPGEWHNPVNYEEMIRSVTGETDGYVVWHIRERSLELFNDVKQGYQRTIWLYRTVDKADSALGAAAMANRVGNKVNFLAFLSKITPKPDTAQVIDLSLKLVVELLAFCQLHNISVTNIGGFANALQHYHSEALMRMAALICVDGLVPLGPDFTDVVLAKLHQMNASDLENEATFKPLSGIIPGENTASQLSFITESFSAVEGWIDGFLEQHGLSREKVLASIRQFVDIADDKLDYVAAFFDMTTNYYEHTGIQTVARCLIERAAADVQALPDLAQHRQQLPGHSPAASLPAAPPAPPSPPGAPLPPAPASSTAPDLTPFYAADGRYTHLKQQFDAGVLSQHAFDTQLQQMMVQDHLGRWWSKERHTGQWHYHDAASNGWVAGTPPGYPPQSPPAGGDAPAPQPAPAPAAQPPAGSSTSALFQHYSTPSQPAPPAPEPQPEPAASGSSLFQRYSPAASGRTPAEAPQPEPATPAAPAPGSSLFQRYSPATAEDTPPEPEPEPEPAPAGSSLFQRYQKPDDESSSNDE